MVTISGVALPDGAGEPGTIREAAFDATLQKLGGPTSMETGSTAYEGYLHRLKALLPADDRLRDAVSLRVLQITHLAGCEARSMLCRAGYIMLTNGPRHGLPEYDKAVAILADSKE